MKNHYQIIVIGAGTGGMMTASQLRRKDKTLDIAIIDPSEYHYYQPAWTLVGAGTYNYEDTKRTTKSLIPEGVQWIKEKVSEIDPEKNQLSTDLSGHFTYDYLIVAPGLVYDLDMVEGLKEALDLGVVCSNYINPNYTWELMQKFQGGNAIFTMANTPIKCGGAPQKTMYLAADYFKKKGIAQKTKITYVFPGTVIFGIEKIAKTLQKVIDRHNISLEPLHFLYKIDPIKNIAFYKHKEKSVEIPFDFLHLAPPQTAPSFIKNSKLSNESGWMEVDKASMQHLEYRNVFGLGDVAGLPTAKTGAAIRKQAPVVVENILKLIKGQKADNKSYEGYSSCPLVTGYGKMVLAEFNYKNEFTPDPQLKKMLIMDSSKEHWRLWILKKYMLPYLYWNKMMKGKDV